MTENSNNEDELRELQMILRNVAEKGPNTFESLAARLRTMSKEVRETLALVFEQPFNAELRRRSQTSYKEKKALAKWANAELRGLGLAFQCPKTGLPALLFADRGNDPACGRFQLEVAMEQNARKRTISMDILPDTLKLMPANLRRSKGVKSA